MRNDFIIVPQEQNQDYFLYFFDFQMIKIFIYAIFYAQLKFNCTVYYYKNLTQLKYLFVCSSRVFWSYFATPLNLIHYHQASITLFQFKIIYFLIPINTSSIFALWSCSIFYNKYYSIQNRSWHYKSVWKAKLYNIENY